MEKLFLTSAIALKIEMNMRVILSQFKNICKDLMSNISILRFEGSQTEELYYLNCLRSFHNMKRMDSASMRIWYELCIHKLYQTSCRLREVLCYIRWLLFCISRYCVTLRKCCLTFVDNFFISRKILKLRVFILPNCDIKCADDVNLHLTLYFYLPTKHPDSNIFLIQQDIFIS